MKFQDIYRVSPKRQDVTETEIKAFEKEWNIKLPKDFWAFVRQFGPGDFCGYLNIFDPQRMSENQKLYKKIMEEAPAYYWEESQLTQKEAFDSVNVTHSPDGDEFVYHSGRNSGFFVLPRHSEIIYKLGDTFIEVLDWVASAGIFYLPTKFKWFCTFKDCCCLHIVKDQYVSHAKALPLIEHAFGKVAYANLNEEKNSSIFFCPQISGYIHVNTYHSFSDISLAIYYDLDFDAKVYQAAKENFFSQGFRQIEHRRP